jgi:hypothetical protein
MSELLDDMLLANCCEYGILLASYWRLVNGWMSLCLG